MHPFAPAYHRGRHGRRPRVRPPGLTVVAVVALATILALVGLGLKASAAKAVSATLYVDQANPSCNDAGPGTSPSMA